ncbi:hypothetical protein [Enterococcus mundtii]|uniref:hypothetical protein n=1 Tax=Enterococcus mundtii TaxID=53346 RepID=UPI001A962DA0|nr:hypothetical protein [Enterococcus mundtii]MBO1087194.1 hypothetical protein [Enterococcus mundtii]
MSISKGMMIRAMSENELKDTFVEKIMNLTDTNVKINGWDMAYLFQETKGKSLLQLQQMYLERTLELEEYEKGDSKVIKTKLDKLINEQYYLADKIVRKLIGK